MEGSVRNEIDEECGALATFSSESLASSSNSVSQLDVVIHDDGIEENERVDLNPLQLSVHEGCLDHVSLPIAEEKL
eukprot:3920316-Ditylum_brightwellii.AAC.1